MGTEGSEKLAAKAGPVIEERGFNEVVKTLLGKVVTIVNPESYEDAPLGHQIRAGWYQAKVVGMGNDYLILVTEYVHAGSKTDSREPVKQFIPLAQIKRVSVMKSERLIHI